MASKKQQLNKRYIYLITGGIVLVIVAALVMGIRSLLHNDGGMQQKHVQMVTIVTPPPPPPPKVEEKPPEPPKIEEKIEVPKEELSVDKPDDTSKDLPPSDNLGLDAEAGLGSDAFGLAAKKGGSSLIGGTGGKNAGSLYGWYANVVSNKLQKTANDIIQKDGGIPTGKWDKVTFEVMVDVFGKVTKFSILKSSGNEKIDGAVKQALQMAHTFEPPPPGMPKVMKFAVSLQG